jgi:hypothetical protein
MLPIQGPPDPKDDHHYDEYFSKAGHKIVMQRECLHDWMEVDDKTCYCRLCDKTELWANLKPDTSTVMMKAYGLSFMVPMKCLPESFQRTIQIRRQMAGEK